jgi:hypothetical protein
MKLTSACVAAETANRRPLLLLLPVSGCHASSLLASRSVHAMPAAGKSSIRPTQSFFLYFKEALPAMSAKKKDVFIFPEDLSAITAGANMSFDAFLQNIDVKMSCLQANPYRMQRMIEAFGKMNYMNGLKDEAMRHRQGSRQ